MIHQLRIYEIFERNKAAFHDRFRNHAARIMRSYGFDIIAMWESKTNDRTEFVYLLVWPDEQTMLRAWGQFRADEEWKKIKKLTTRRRQRQEDQKRRRSSRVQPSRAESLCGKMC